MSRFLLHKTSKKNQYLICISTIVLVSILCYSLSHFIGYKIVALILLASVSFLAMFLDMFPVLLAAVLSAITWDYFFIPPRFTLFIDNTEDMLMFIMYFIIALVNAVLTLKIRAIEKIAREKEKKENNLKLYNTLLNSLSHELRTPISTIIAATDNLQIAEEKISTENKTALISEISKAALRLNTQVENLLNMSRLESGFIEPKKDWCDVHELVHTVVNQIKETTGNRNINIHIQDDIPLVILNFGLMEQVLYNLISNANLYTPENCTISIIANYSNNLFQLIIEDNGPGFPESEKEKAFEKFYRGKNTQTGGTGLGLSIVKGFVEAHNGTIQLENKKEGGAKFTIKIPSKKTIVSSLKNE